MMRLNSVRTLIFSTLILMLTLTGAAGCHKPPIERGEVFSAVEKTLGLAGESNPVKDDLIKRGLFTVPSDNGTAGEIKIGEIEQLVKDNVYAIDKDGYLQFGPAYTSPPSSPITNPSETAVPTTSSQNQQPIEVMSVIGPLQPFIPAGPEVEITLKNVSEVPVIALKATLELGKSFEFNFVSVTPSDPLLPGKSSSVKRVLIGGGFGSGISYTLMINVTLQNGVPLVYTKQVQIAEPTPD